jgi:hypothetical protein
MGREHYVGDGEEINEANARSFPATRPNGLSHLEVSTIVAFNGFQSPPKLARDSLVDSFLQYCNPWMPILTRSDIDSLRNGTAPALLAQALYLAASRVSSSPLVQSFASSHEFYERTKVLFWMGQEHVPLTIIKATLMMQWYNPEGPEHVSLDTSEFWLKTGVGLAHQVGLHKEPSAGPMYTLRRRLWWSLVARDSLIAAAHGRPRAINLEDAEVRPPTPADFDDSENEGQLFIRYVEICRLLGDLTECCARHYLPNSKRFDIEASLLRWPDSLIPALRLPSTPSAANFNARQLHLPYLMSIMVCSRFTTRSVSRPAILAASYSCAIFEGFLARDEVRYLAPVFTIYCLSSGFTLLSLYPFPALWTTAQSDYNIIRSTLSELSKRWRSAIGGLKAIQSALQCRERAIIGQPLRPLEAGRPDWDPFSGGFPMELCKMHNPYDLEVAAQTRELELAAHAELNQGNGDGDDITIPVPHSTHEPFGYDESPYNSTWDLFQYDHFGNWLLHEPVRTG